MSGRKIMMASCGLAVFGMIAVAFQSNAQEGITTIPVETPRVNQQSIEIYMQAKLTNAEHVLAGLVDQDFEGIRKAARNLKLTSLKSPVLHTSNQDDNKVFEHFETEFLRLSNKLEIMAEQENLEGAAFVYQNLTTTCIACHQHVRSSDQ